MKIKKIDVFPIRVKNDFDQGRKSDTGNINTAMLEIKNLKKTQKSAPKEKKVEKRNLEPKALGNYETKTLNDGWTAVTKDKKLSAQFEHTVGITKDGYEIFTQSKKFS